MEREEKYIVVKIRDAQKHLSDSQLNQLFQLVQTVDDGRVQAGKHPMESIVVEVDWPEYEPVWKMISDRVDGIQLTKDSTERFPLPQGPAPGSPRKR